MFLHKGCQAWLRGGDRGLADRSSYSGWHIRCVLQTTEFASQRPPMDRTRILVTPTRCDPPCKPQLLRIVSPGLSEPGTRRREGSRLEAQGL